MSKGGNNTTLLLAGAGAVGLYLLLKNTGTATATTVPAGSSTAVNVPTQTSTVPGQTLQAGETYPYVIAAGHPPVPATWDFNYYLTWVYPAMKAVNPNVGNSGYTLSPAEAQQYYANYLDLQQWVPTVVPHTFPNQNAAMQYHWSHNAVAESRTFLPFLPTSSKGYTPPPANANSSGGGSFWSTAGTIATAVIAIAGPQTPLLNDYEVEVIVDGAYIAKQILPLYYTDNLALAAEDKLDELLTQYSR